MVELVRDGRFGDVAARFSPPLRALVSAEALGQAWAAEVDRNGPVVAIGAPVGEAAAVGVTHVRVPVSCARGELTVVMSVDEHGLLAGMQLVAANNVWEPPPYAEPGEFAEREVHVGDGPLTVPGTMTVSRRDGPGVVLLSGAGPFDRDETSGANKPLKDLAWGLASRGVTTLRFDKATYANPDLVPATIADEYVPHALAAVRLLRQQSNVDRVFVLGHSAGGKVAPRVAAADPDIAGIIVMAGDAQPLPEAAARVARYLTRLDPAFEAFAEQLVRQAALAGGPELTVSTPTDELPFGMPASYWLDLREYDQVATAAALGRPVLVLQGGRDYQVTVEHDLALWRAGLGEKATFRVYARDNHLFHPGTGPSTPAEYVPAQHLNPDVVADVAAWLAGGAVAAGQRSA